MTKLGNLVFFVLTFKKEYSFGRPAWPPGVGRAGREPFPRDPPRPAGPHAAPLSFLQPVAWALALHRILPGPGPGPTDSKGLPNF